MPTHPIRVLVADDHAVVREGIRRVLEHSSDIEVVGEAQSGTEALAVARECAPDVVVLDITMPGESGLEIAPTLRAEVPGARILILSIHDHEEYVLRSVRAGASGYLRKDSSPGELRDAVRAVGRGNAFFSALAARQLSAALRGDAEREERSSRLASLTSREREVLLGVASGETNKEIASRLGLSPRTVESHRESLMRKLEIRNVAGLTRLAVEEGIVDVGGAPGADR